MPNALPLVRSSQMRAIGVTTKERSALAPEIPSLAESGCPISTSAPGTGLFVPSGTPRAIVKRLNAETLRIAGEKDYVARIRSMVRTSRARARKRSLSSSATMSAGGPQSSAMWASRKSNERACAKQPPMEDLMSYEAITVEPVSPHIGAEIGNVDLTKPLANKQVEELHRAFIQYQVIFFRDQRSALMIRSGWAVILGRSARMSGNRRSARRRKSVRPEISL